MLFRSPMSLYQNPANVFVAGFLGTPSINFMDMRVESRKVYVAGEDLTDSANDAALRLEDGSYILGVRPEDLRLRPSRPEGSCIAAKLDLVEHLGAESLVYFSLQGKNYCCRTDFDEAFKQGQNVFFEIDFNSSSVFDVVTERRIV